jgi:hypothetical protein
MLPKTARLIALCALSIGLSTPALTQPSSKASAGFDAYILTIEARLEQQHRSRDAFLAPVTLPNAGARLHDGELLIEKLTPDPGPNLPDALLFVWRGTAFVPGAKAADFESLLRDFNAYPKVFAPQVVQASILSRTGNYFQPRLRVRQHHVLTVVLDTTYDVAFGHLDPAHGYNLSRSIDISEIESAGTPSEHALPPEKAHGFLWRLNSYWSWEQRDGGLYIQIESASLTRSIPAGLGWAIRPFVESVPRESLEFTLRSAASALRK